MNFSSSSDVMDSSPRSGEPLDVPPMQGQAEQSPAPASDRIVRLVGTPAELSAAQEYLGARLDGLYTVDEVMQGLGKAVLHCRALQKTVAGLTEESVGDIVDTAEQESAAVSGHLDKLQRAILTATREYAAVKENIERQKKRKQPHDAYEEARRKQQEQIFALGRELDARKQEIADLTRGIEGMEPDAARQISTLQSNLKELQMEKDVAVNKQIFAEIAAEQKDEKIEDLYAEIDKLKLQVTEITEPRRELLNKRREVERSLRKEIKDLKDESLQDYEIYMDKIRAIRVSLQYIFDLCFSSTIPRANFNAIVELNEIYCIKELHSWKHAYALPIRPSGVVFFAETKWLVFADQLLSVPSSSDMSQSMIGRLLSYSRSVDALTDEQVTETSLLPHLKWLEDGILSMFRPGRMIDLNMTIMLPFLLHHFIELFNHMQMTYVYEYAAVLFCRLVLHWPVPKKVLQVVAEAVQMRAREDSKHSRFMYTAMVRVFWTCRSLNRSLYEEEYPTDSISTRVLDVKEPVSTMALLDRIFHRNNDHEHLAVKDGRIFDFSATIREVSDGQVKYTPVKVLLVWERHREHLFLQEMDGRSSFIAHEAHETFFKITKVENSECAVEIRCADLVMEFTTAADGPLGKYLQAAGGSDHDGYLFMAEWLHNSSRA